MPVAMSYSPPSGLTSETIQISRLSTMPLICGSVAYFVGQLVESVERHLDGQVLAGVLVAVKSTSGSSSSTPTLSEILPAHSSRPS